MKNLLSLGLLAFGICGGASGQTFRAITSEGPWGNYEAFPDVCRLAGGDLFVVFYAGTGHVTLPSDNAPTGGSVYGMRSSDGGKTWSRPSLVIDTPQDDRDPHVCQLANGDLLVTKDNVLVCAHRHPGTAVSISTDDGATWRAPWQIDTAGGAYPGLAELDDGSIVCIYYEEGAGSSIREAVFRVEPGIRLHDLDVRWPPPPPPGAPIDLRAMHAEGKLTITTDMQWTDAERGAGPTAVFDGNVEHFHAAWKAVEDRPATYAIELDKAYELTGLGICLKQGQGARDFAESAEVYLSQDGDQWDQPVATFEDAVTKSVLYKSFPAPVSAKFVKVVITKSDGWPGLNELELYAR